MTLDISAIRQRIENSDGDNFSWLEVVEELCDEVERLRAETRWIPVEEKLPEPRQACHIAYITSDGVYQQGTSCWFNDICQNTWRGYWWADVTHWMPLPEPPVLIHGGSAPSVPMEQSPPKEGK